MGAQSQPNLLECKQGRALLPARVPKGCGACRIQRALRRLVHAAWGCMFHALPLPVDKSTPIVTSTPQCWSCAHPCVVTTPELGCLQNAEGALGDLRAAAKLAPADKGIRAALAQAKAQEKTSVDQQRAAYRRMMAPSKPDPPAGRTAELGL